MPHDIFAAACCLPHAGGSRFDSHNADWTAPALRSRLLEANTQARQRVVSVAAGSNICALPFATAGISNSVGGGVDRGFSGAQHDVHGAGQISGARFWTF